MSGSSHSYALIGNFPKHVPIGMTLDGRHVGQACTAEPNWIDDLLAPADVPKANHDVTSDNA